MTPLAQRIVGQLTLPLKDRTFRDQDGLMARMSDVHCFDITDVYELCEKLLIDLNGRMVGMKQATFLPAPRTWIEFNGAGESGEKKRCGYLLEQSGDGAASVWVVLGDGFSSRYLGTLKLGPIPTVIASNKMVEVGLAGGNHITPALEFILRFIYVALALINTPRVIGRRQHMPHRGLERKLLKLQGQIGSYPLHAWTEISLSVSFNSKDEDGTEHEAHLTGRKCLHFCRSHLRIQNGQVVLVNAHWRGDPALGIKRSRYRLAA